MKHERAEQPSLQGKHTDGSYLVRGLDALVVVLAGVRTQFRFP